MAKRYTYPQAQVPYNGSTVGFNDAIEQIATKTHRRLGAVARLVQCHGYDDLRLYLRGERNPSPELIGKVSLELQRVCS
jgi:hypothetical protein